MKFDFPGTMKPAGVEERERFYRESFPREVLKDKMERWNVFVPVVDVGSDTTLYRPRHKALKGTLVRLEDYDDIGELRDRIIDLAPEDIYYVTTVEKEGMVETNPDRELVFDLDPDHIACEDCRRRRKYLDENAAASTFCGECFSEVAEETLQLFSFLKSHFDDIRIFYSGRGFHIHVEDETGFRMDREDRRELAGKVEKQFPIDTEVTGGDSDLIRLPGSLNGLVSREVVEVEPDELQRPRKILESRGVPAFVQGL